MVDHKIPRYIQIYDQIRNDIASGTWQVGEKLPSERELAELFNVSRMTLRQAIQVLVDDGIIERKVGSGTFVARQKVQEHIDGVVSFSQIIRSQGKIPSSKTIHYYQTEPNELEKTKLCLRSEDILRMERIRYADHIPICFEVTSVPYHLIASYTQEEITQSLYEVLQKNPQQKLGRAIQTISATTASDKLAQYLETEKHDAILKVSQISYFQDGTPFEWVNSHYVGHRFEFYLEKKEKESYL